MSPSPSSTETTMIVEERTQTTQQQLSNGKKLIISNRTIICSVIVFALFTHLIYKPLPDGFPQPWKYRLICFGSDLVTAIGKILEYFNLGHRLSLIRFSYYMTVGLFNIRDANDNIQISDHMVANVPIRVYRPLNSSYSSGNKLPAIFYYHGGGYFVGSADVCEPISYLLAKHTQAIVIYVEYRLIPDFKFPSALNDSLDATKYIIRNADLFNIDLHNVILVGDSAGGNLASVINRKLIEDNVIRPKLKVLIYPILQFFDFTLPSYRQFMSQRILGNIDEENFKNFIHYFTGYEVDDTILENGHSASCDKESELGKYVDKSLLPQDYSNNNEFMKPVSQQLNSTITHKVKHIILHPDVSPLLVPDSVLKNYSALHTYVLTVGHDILRDDGMIYVKRLNNLNINVKHEHYHDLFHGIFGLLHGPLQFDLSHFLMEAVSNHIRHVITL